VTTIKLVNQRVVVTRWKPALLAAHDKAADKYTLYTGSQGGTACAPASPS